MKKFLFLINTLRLGGAEKVLVDTVNSLVDQGVEITVQTICNDNIYISELNPAIKYKSIINVKSKLLAKCLLSIVVRFFSPKWLYNLFIKDAYDLEVSFLEGLPTKLIAASTNKASKKIAWLHTDLIAYPDSYKVFKTEEKEKKAYSKFDAIACISDGVKDSLIKKYGHISPEIKTVYNIVDEEKIQELSNEDVKICFERPLLISVGRLCKVKGYDGLLRVIKRLKEDNIKCDLWIVGEGEERADLETYIKENRLDNVKLLGFKENPYKYMTKADIFISSSIAEGFSMVITEAVVLGLPVISTNTVGANEPKEAPRCSIIVKNEDELYIKLKEVLTDEEKMKSLKASILESQHFLNRDYLLKELKMFFAL